MYITLGLSRKTNVPPAKIQKMKMVASLINFSYYLTRVVQNRVSNGTGQGNFLGQRDRNFFLVPADKGTTGQAQNFSTGRDGILTACPVLSRDVPRDRNERKNIDEMAFFSMISCFRSSFPILEHPLLF